MCKFVSKLFRKKKQPTAHVVINNYDKWSLFEKQVAELLNSKRKVPLIPNKDCHGEATKRVIFQLAQPTITHDFVGVAFNALGDLGYYNHGEILAYGFSNAESVVNAWMKSTRHKKMILNSTFKYFGVSVLQSNRKYYFCVLFTNKK